MAARYFPALRAELVQGAERIVQEEVVLPGVALARSPGALTNMSTVNAGKAQANRRVDVFMSVAPEEWVTGLVAGTQRPGQP